MVLSYCPLRNSVCGFLAQLDGVSTPYHIPAALRLGGALDVVAWRRSLDRLFARHESLRSIFIATDGQPMLNVAT